MKLTHETMAEAKRDLQRLNNPGYGGFNLTYNDGYFAMSLERKWGMSTGELARRVERMEAKMQAKADSTNGAGI